MMAKITKAADIPIDLTGWTLDAIPDLETIILKAAAEALRRALTGDGTDQPYVYFPIIWAPEGDGMGGSPQENPLSVYLCMSLTAGEDDDRPAWKFTIDELVDDLLDAYKQKGEWPSHERKNAEDVRDALRRQADRIDAAIR